VTTGAGWGAVGVDGAGVADAGGGDDAEADGVEEVRTAGDRWILRIVVVRRTTRLVRTGRLA
jgi:hypothetical protein